MAVAVVRQGRTVVPCGRFGARAADSASPGLPFVASERAFGGVVGATQQECRKQVPA